MRTRSKYHQFWKPVASDESNVYSNFIDYYQGINCIVGGKKGRKQKFTFVSSYPFQFPGKVSKGMPNSPFR